MFNFKNALHCGACAYTDAHGRSNKKHTSRCIRDGQVSLTHPFLALRNNKSKFQFPAFSFALSSSLAISYAKTIAALHAFSWHILCSNERHFAKLSGIRRICILLIFCDMPQRNKNQASNVNMDCTVLYIVYCIVITQIASVFKI